MLLFGLPPHRWKIAVAVDTMGSGYRATGTGFCLVEVPPGGEVQSLALGVGTMGRPVIKTFERGAKPPAEPAKKESRLRGVDSVLGPLRRAHPPARPGRGV